MENRKFYLVTYVDDKGFEFSSVKMHKTRAIAYAENITHATGFVCEITVIEKKHCIAKTTKEHGLIIPVSGMRDALKELCKDDSMNTFNKVIKVKWEE